MQRRCLLSFVTGVTVSYTADRSHSEFRMFKLEQGDLEKLALNLSQECYGEQE